MTNKKNIILTIVIGLLALTSILAIGKTKTMDDEVKRTHELNVKLNEQNKKLLDANNKADKKIDDLSSKYDAINKELEEIKKENNQGQ
ncbi:hypothetical protein [Vagococcus carniphilus]|uniref:hypothetical protein n=1 Tax=Vagococcus carniphilus TaxID=218144 RepID=UPI003B5AEB69